MGDLVALPYGGLNKKNSGHSGSETSQQRAEEADASGVTLSRQTRVMQLLNGQAERGLTWKQVDVITGWNHHGKTTGVLSNLHKVGRISRLTETRDRCKVYVLNEHVNGREVEPPGNRNTVLVDDMATLLRDALPEGCCTLHRDRARVQGCWACDAAWALRRYDA